MNFYELKTQSRHSDIGMMAQNISDFEHNIINIDAE